MPMDNIEKFRLAPSAFTRDDSIINRHE